MSLNRNIAFFLLSYNLISSLILNQCHKESGHDKESKKGGQHQTEDNGTA